MTRFLTHLIQCRFQATAFGLFVGSVLIAMNCAVSATAAPQDKPPEKQAERDQKENSATLRGKVILKSDRVKDLDWSELKGTVGQLVAMEQPKNLPKDWQTMSPQKRMEWSKAFQESEEGKELIARNQKKLDERFLEEFPIREGGRFVIYDVPPGQFELNITALTEIDGRTYIVRNAGRIAVGEVDEVDLGEMPLEVLRLLKIGDQAPDFGGTTDSGKQMTLSQLQGKHTLLAFGLTANPAFKQTTAMLKEAANNSASKDKLNVLTVTVDEDLNAVAKFNRENGVSWNSLNLGGWDTDVLSEYGLNMVPSIWLLDADGKIVLTGSQFLFEINRTQLSISKLVDEAISGRLIIGGEAPEEDQEGEDSTDQ